METFKEYIAKIENPEQRQRVVEILQWVADEYPGFEKRIAWNQPMFTDHGTFIIAFNIAKNHLNISPELAGIEHFSGEIIKAGYKHTKMLIQIKWDDPVDYGLLKRIIDYNVIEKKNCETFWRK